MTPGSPDAADDGVDSAPAARGGREPRVSRRRAIATATVAAAGLVGGCTGLFGDDGTPGDTPSVGSTTETGTKRSPTGPERSPTGTDRGDPTPGGRHVGYAPVPPGNRQYNLFNPTRRPVVSHRVLFEPFAKYSYVENAFRPAAVRSWTLRDRTFRLELREDLAWTDGTAVTAADVATQLRLGRYVDDPVWNWARRIRTPDDHTVAVDVDGPRNPAILERDVLAGRVVRTHRDRYGPYLENVRDGGSVDALRNFADRDPITCGPFRVAERAVGRLVTARFEGHPAASALGFEEYVFRAFGAEGSPVQALRDLAVDSVHAATVPARVVANFPDAVESVTTPDVFGAGLVPNHDHRHLGDRAVRQAIAYAVDREGAVEHSLPLSKVAPVIPTGLASGVRTDWLGESDGPFETYGVGTATDRATAVLASAGYERRDGTWVGPDGAAVDLPVAYPNHLRDWGAVADAVVDDLSAFGFDASLDPRERAYDDALAGGDFVLALASWLPDGTVPTPHRTLDHLLRKPARRPVRYAYPGASSDDGVGGGAEPVTVPARDGDGTTAVDVAGRLDALARATDPARRRRHVRDLAWVANVDLPMLPVVERLNQQWLTTDDWAVPDDLASDPDANVEWAPIRLAREGKLRYTG